MADSSSLHRVHRLRWQARAPNAADAFALQSLLKRRNEDVSAALEQALANIGLGDGVWHLPSLTLRLDASSLVDMDANLPALVANALQTTLHRAWLANAVRHGPVTTPASTPADEAATDREQPGIVITPAESAHAALRYYLDTGSLPWALAGLSHEAQQQTLQGAAHAAMEALLVRPDTVAALTELLGASTPLPTRIGALLRWLPLLSPAHQQRWRALSPRPPSLAASLADRWFAVLASSHTPLAWTALWLVWPTVRDNLGSTGSPEANAIAHWIAALPAGIAAVRLMPRDATEDHLAAALLNALGESPTKFPPPPLAPSTSKLLRPSASAHDALLVPLAGLVLLHPYLPRFLTACELQTIDDASLPRACALLHALACGDAEAAEHQLPLIKLMLGRAPDEPLTSALPRLSAADREEVDGLLDAARSHWKAIGNTSANGLRLSFLQRRGLLRRADGAWQMHMQVEAFDMLLDLLPWSISLVKLPWMPLPLMVEWHSP
jgi:hypothetical protein